LSSSFLDNPVKEGTIVIGEIGLTGEIRAIGHIEARVKEASKMGFTRCILPENSTKQVPKLKNMDIYGIKSLKQVMELLF